MGVADPTTVNLAFILGWLFAPIAWLMGISPAECRIAGELLGIKMVATEFMAYEQLGTILKSSAPALSPRSSVILTYALCGFSNFASIGIQVGGIGSLAPDRRRELTELAFKAMLGGTIACCMTGCIAAVLL
jgi:CNT family concentrative nucleoside transporter